MRSRTCRASAWNSNVSIFVVMRESVARRVGSFKMGGRRKRGRLNFVAGSTKLMDRHQDSFALLDSCQRAKSAPSIKNFRPIWTIRICSSSMILRKWRTENPANSAAFGISRNVFLTTIPSVDFIGSSFVREEHARPVPMTIFDIALLYVSVSWKTYSAPINGYL